MSPFQDVFFRGPGWVRVTLHQVPEIVVPESVWYRLIVTTGACGRV